MQQLKLTLGPIPFHWSADEKLAFYRDLETAPVDEVYLGEVICSKRQPYFDPHLITVAEALEAAGKRVILCGLAEVMLKRERVATEGIAALDEREIELNNAAGLFFRQGRPHRVGPFLNVYNEATLAVMADKGLTHATVPAELPGPAIALLAQAARARGVGLEVQVYGRASLAVSARCYHARAHGRTKDNCQFVCEEDPDGMALTTRDGQAFLRINGIQTLSESYVSLAEEVPELARMGVTHLRLMPQRVDMGAVVTLFRDLLEARRTPSEVQDRLAELSPAPLSNGFFHGTAGYRRIAAKGRDAA